MFACRTRRHSDEEEGTSLAGSPKRGRTSALTIHATRAEIRWTIPNDKHREYSGNRITKARQRFKRLTPRTLNILVDRLNGGACGISFGEQNQLVRGGFAATFKSRLIETLGPSSLTILRIINSSSVSITRWSPVLTSAVSPTR